MIAENIPLHIAVFLSFSSIALMNSAEVMGTRAIAVSLGNAPETVA